MWYGKGPGVDRAGDALKHGNAYGSSPHGGVLVVAGDDHGCVSSSMPHQSDHAVRSRGTCRSWQPASVAEYLEFGLYGWALSRFSGNWVGFTALSEVVESGAHGRPRPDRTRASPPGPMRADGARRHRPSSRRPTACTTAGPTCRRCSIESRLARQARRGARLRARQQHRPPRDREPAREGRHRHLRQGALRPDGGAAPPRHHARQRSPRAGVRLYKVGLSFPIEPTRIAGLRARAGRDPGRRGEGRGRREPAARPVLQRAAGARPALVGKHDRDGRPLVSALGELRPSRLIELVAHWLAAHFPATRPGDHLSTCATSRRPSCCRNDGDAVKRLPYFCAGCPHNTSDQGARRLDRAGRHRLPLHGQLDGPRAPQA